MTESLGPAICKSQAWVHIAQFWATSTNIIELQLLNKRFYTSNTFVKAWVRTVYRIPKMRLSNHLMPPNKYDIVLPELSNHLMKPNKYDIVFPDLYQKESYISRDGQLPYLAGVKTNELNGHGSCFTFNLSNGDESHQGKNGG